MTDHSQHPPISPDDDAENAAPLDEWMLALARDASSEVTVPSELMWRRVQRARDEARVDARSGDEHDERLMVPLFTPQSPVHVFSTTGTTAASASAQRPSRPRSMWRAGAGIAAVLFGGIAIGRYALPHPSNTTHASNARAVASADSLTMPTRVAMDEHLVRTAALLTAVRDRDVTVATGQDVSAWARDLLGTTRLLLDEPSLRDDRTRQLLQDLELVLMQIAQARGTDAPEAQRAPAETMRETNLLPRVRAAVSAATQREEPLLRGAAE